MYGFLFITEPNLSLSGTSIGGQVFKIYYKAGIKQI